MPAPTLLQHATLPLQELTPDICLLGSFSLKISHIEIIYLSTANLTFLQCKSYISPVQISYFYSTNLTFLQRKSHISPVQISHFSSANLTFLQSKSHISPVQISHFSSANLTFLQCKIPPSYLARLSNVHAHGLAACGPSWYDQVLCQPEDWCMKRLRWCSL